MMVKLKKFLLLVGILLLGALQQANAQSQEKIVSMVRKAALAASEQIMKKVSPNTGRDNDYDINYESIAYDKYAQEVECQVVLSWSAKEYMLSLTRDTCQTWGKLYINLETGSSRFISKGENSWFKTCADSHWANALKAGVAIVVLTR